MGPISEVFALLIDWSTQLGAENISALPGCWENRLGEHWRVAINGHRDPCSDSTGAEVPPYHAYLEYRGWPAGLVNPRGGTIVNGEGANEDALIEVLRQEIGVHRA